jgi:hypothetical protein
MSARCSEALHYPSLKKHFLYFREKTCLLSSFEDRNNGGKMSKVINVVHLPIIRA